MGSIFRAPKIPDPQPMQMSKVEDVPEAPVEEDAELVAEQEAEQRAKERKRKGRRSTILTGTGLNEIEDQEINKRTLLG